MTLFRLEGFGPSVLARSAMLPEILRAHCGLRVLDPDDADRYWRSIRIVEPFDGDARPLWRAHLPPSRSCALIETLERQGADWFADWAGGLIWLSFDGDPALVRAAAEAAGGHAALVRAPAAVRSRVPAQHPRQPAVMKLETRVRRAFDPLGIFETGRFLDGDHAD